MGMAKYEKPCSLVVLLTGMNVLQNQSDGTITDDPANIPAFRAFFSAKNSLSSDVNEVRMIFDDDDATSINGLNEGVNDNTPIFNLAGQRLQKMQKGINIVGGKKVLIRN